MKLAKTLAVVAVVSGGAVASMACSGGSEILYIISDEAGTKLPSSSSGGSSSGGSTSSGGSSSGGSSSGGSSSGGSSSGGSSSGGMAEEGTVGQLCMTDAQCEVAGSVGDNVCSIGFFTIGYLYGDPVCVS